MRHGPARLAKRQALHVLTLSGPGQQYLRRKAAILADTPILQSCRCTLSSGGSSDWPKRQGPGRVLPPTVIGIGKQKAVTATARKIAVLFYNAIRHGMTYQDQGAAAYDERHRQRVLSNLQRRAKTLGFALEPIPQTEAVS